MLRDLTRNAIKKYNDDPIGYEQFFLENYKLKDGIYFKLGIKDKEIIIKDKLEIKQDENVILEELNDFFKYRDKLSFIEVSNKTIDKAKKIYSTNIFSFCVRLQQFNDEFNEKKKKKKLDLEHFEKNYIDKLYEQESFVKMLKIFKNDEEKLKKNIELYKLKEYFESEERKEMFNYLKKLYLNGFDKLKEYLLTKYDDSYGTTYFKFYLEGFERELKLESDLYFYSYNFINIKYNILSDDDILMGLHAYDITLDEKKKFIISRTKYSKKMSMMIPETIPYTHLKVYKDVYNYIISKSREKNNNMDIDFDFNNDGEFSKNTDAIYQIYTTKGLADIDIINYRKKIPPFILKNYLDIDLKENDMYNKNKDKHLFKKLFLKLYLYEELDEKVPLKRIDNDLLKYYNFSSLTKNTFLSYKNILHNFFYHGHTHIIEKQIDKMANNFVEGLLITNFKKEDYFRYNMIHGINMYISLLEYFKNKKGEDIAMNLNLIKSKLEDIGDSYKIESITEFCYVSGVVGYYLVSQTEAKKKTYQLLEGVYNASNIKVVKNRLSTLFDKYKYKINLGNFNFKNLFNAILEFEDDIKNIKEYKIYIYAGSLSNNILYRKNKGDDTDE